MRRLALAVLLGFAAGTGFCLAVHLYCHWF
jgi:hypothetical protein